MRIMRGCISYQKLWWIGLLLCLGLARFATPRHVTAQQVALTFTASFADKTIAPSATIEVRTNRPLTASEGRLALLVGATDLTALCTVTAEGLQYGPPALPLPIGESEVKVFLVSPAEVWTEVARFKLVVAANATPETPVAPVVTEGQTPVAANGNGQAAAQPTPLVRRFGFDKFETTPGLNIGMKSQFAETHFPDANRPDRPRFMDATLQGTWRSEMARGTWKMNQQFDLVGSSFRNEALRFGQLQREAPLVDLSSYQMQFQNGTRRLVMGHSSAGAQRHLLNNFGSRGFNFTLPINTRLDATLVAMNGTNVVGWSNFTGLANRRHRLFAAIVGLELLAKRPGGLRLEGGVSDAWFTADRVNFNQNNINDGERSRGASARVLAKNKSERVRIDAGYTRSQFSNPEDPLLNQGASLVPSRVTTRNARYADVSFDLLKDFSFIVTPLIDPNAPAPAAQTVNAQAPPPEIFEPKKLNLTFNYRHERVDPLFKSIGAAAQPDVDTNQAELIGTFGELSFSAAHTRLNDNLAGIQTILRTNTRRTAFNATTPLQALFRLRQSTTPVPNVWLPRLGYAFERVSAYAAFTPLGGGFDELGALPDQRNTTHTATSEWQFGERFKNLRVAYSLNHSMQDNRALTRERADLQNFVHGLAVGMQPMPTLDFAFEINFEDANNREQIRTDRTLRYGLTANWQADLRNSFNVIFSTIGQGDLGRSVRNRNLEFDLQWNYKLTRENPNKFKKWQANYFVRYANRYARNRNFLDALNVLNRANTFNTGLNFIFF